LDVEDLPIRSDFALTLTLALHELATNAAKYGALSSATGRVRLTARVERAEDRQEFSLVWDEEGGPPVQPPEHTGFGMTLICDAVEHQQHGRAELVWRDVGLLCRLSLPLPEMTTAR
jgi:two-component sensor histidine kinase